MESLHLSYDEVLHEIPYRNLIIMQKDRMHALHGVKVVKTSGKSMAMRRRQNK